MGRGLIQREGDYCKQIAFEEGLFEGGLIEGRGLNRGFTVFDVSE